MATQFLNHEKYQINEEDFVDKIYFEKFRENFICRLCLNIILSPQMCLNCETTFCKHCITKRVKEQVNCPVGNHKIEISPINKTLFKLFQKLKVRSQYLDEVSILDYSSHKQECEENTKRVTKCFNCEKVVPKEKLKYSDIDTIKNQNINYKFEHWQSSYNSSNTNNKLIWINEMIELKNKNSELNLKINEIELDIHAKEHILELIKKLESEFTKGKSMETLKSEYEELVNERAAIKNSMETVMNYTEFIQKIDQYKVNNKRLI